MFPKIRKKIATPKPILQSAFILIVSILLYVIHDTSIKLLSPEVRINQIIFFRSLFGIIPVLFLALFEKRRFVTYKKVFQTNFLRAHLLRCCVFALSLLFYIVGCKLLQLPEVYALSYSSPFFVTLLSALILKEKLSARRLGLLFFGFMGIVIVLRPGSTCFEWQAVAPLLSGLFTALAIIWGRQLSFADSNSSICLIYSLFCIVLSACTLPFIAGTITLADLKLLFLIGILSGLAQWGFLEAFRLTSASVLAPFDYLGLLWATLASYMVFNVLPDNYTILGSVIIIGTGLVNIYFENKKARAAAS